VDKSGRLGKLGKSGKILDKTPGRHTWRSMEYLVCRIAYGTGEREARQVGTRFRAKRSPLKGNYGTNPSNCAKTKDFFEFVFQNEPGNLRAKMCETIFTGTAVPVIFTGSAMLRRDR
jgi:hypothetical protein